MAACGVLLLSFLLTACGDKTPLQPEPDGLEAPVLLPLAQGVSWEYRFTNQYEAYREDPYDYSVWWDRENVSGTFILSVLNEITTKDSILFTLSAVTRPDSSEQMTETYRVKFESDSLWYDQGSGGNWQYMMPGQCLGYYDKKSNQNFIDVRIFLPSVRRYLQDYDRYTVTCRDCYHGENSIYASVNFDERGITDLQTLWTLGSLNFPEQSKMSLWLVSYTPGTP